MKSKSLVLLFVAAGCGLVAMLGVQQMLSSGRQAAPTTVKIVVARVDIDPGIPLDKTNVGFKEWPKDALPEGAITKEEDYAERALKHRVGPGQPILLSELGKKGDFGVETQIPEGMNLVSFPVTSTMTHSGLLKPGSFVDVSAAIEYPQKGGGKKIEIKPVLQCIQVIAVGSQVAGTEVGNDPQAKEAKNVSFLVFPLQGQLLQLAYKQSNGAIQLALRGKSDKTLANLRDLNEQSLTALSNQLLGINDDDSAGAPLAERPSAKTSIKSLVKRQTSPVEMEVGDQAARRTWKIEVFQGENREIQEIPWDEEPQAGVTSSSVNLKQGWAGPLMNFFSKRPKVNSNSPEEDESPAESAQPIEHRPSSFIRRVPEKVQEDEAVIEEESTKEESTKSE